jgi:hypothetical protein
MSFRDLLTTSQILALSEKLHPDEIAVYERYCREFSTRFSTPLLEVRALDPLFVLTQVSCDDLANFNPDENLDALLDMIGSLSDKNYDQKREAAIREEMRLIEEREAERLEKGEAVHASLEKKDKRVIAPDQPKPQMPKSGGINMGLINQLNNSDKEG